MSGKKKERNSTSEPQRTRTFTFELYPEWSYFTNIVSHIVKEKYALILHDKDTNDNGEIKKEHVHVVVKYGGKRTLSSVRNEYAKYGLENRFVDTCNERAMLRYLVHLDNPEKYQYSKNEIDTNMKSECESAWADEVSSEEALLLITMFLEETEKHIPYAEMVKYAIKNNLTKGLKAYGNHINNMLREHNSAYLLKNDVKDVVDRETVKAIAKEHSELKKAEMMADTFGTAVIEEENGEKYALYKKSDEKEKEDKKQDDELWQGLEMVKKS